MVASRDRKPTGGGSSIVLLSVCGLLLFLLFTFRFFVLVFSAETVSSPEIQQVEDPFTLKYRWTIENLSRLKIKELYSNVFNVRGYKWRVLIFPKGNNVDYLSICLDVADSATLPDGWSRYAQFSLAVVDQIHDLQLDVKGSWDVYASFDKYVKVEWLEGDNKYQVENLGLQNIDAYLVAVFAPRPGTDVGFASTSGVPQWSYLQSDELANNQLFEENKPSVVFIENRLPPGASGLGFIGSGFIWDTEGHVVTNNHVIDGADVLSVTLADGTEYKAKVVGCDRDNDAAVLRIDAPKEKLMPIKVGISSNLLIGQKVFAIGHPFHLRFTLTDGIISGLRRKISPANGPPIQDAIQTSVPINPGSSGGPLLDSSGYLIGINTMIFSPSGGFCGVGFAVPVDTVKGIVYQIVNSGEVRRPISGDSGSLQGDQVSVVLEPNPDAP